MCVRVIKVCFIIYYWWELLNESSHFHIHYSKLNKASQTVCYCAVVSQSHTEYN